MFVTVVKCDGGTEDYLHTKVLLCMSNALCAAGEFETDTAVRLAEAVTAFIHSSGDEYIRSAEILRMAKVALRETGHPEAAAALEEHCLRRNLLRARTEVVDGELLEVRDAEKMQTATGGVRQWCKGRVARHFVEWFGLEWQAARAAAGRVEEKVLAMAMPRIWSGLLRQLMVCEAAATLRAETELARPPASELEADVFERDEVSV